MQPKYAGRLTCGGEVLVLVGVLLVDLGLLDGLDLLLALLRLHERVQCLEGLRQGLLVPLLREVGVGQQQLGEVPLSEVGDLAAAVPVKHCEQGHGFIELGICDVGVLHELPPPAHPQRCVGEAR